jgi:coproporphyrinogen III oxidase-like Fe-S oxidoreductase
MDKKLEKKIANFKRITTQKHIYHPFLVFNYESCLMFPEDVKNKWDVFLGKNKSRYVSLYINIPYCQNNKCNYCMYNSKILQTRAELDYYIDYLKGSMEYYDSVFQGYEFANMYIGGGTPTILDNSQLTQLFELLTLRYGFRDNAMKTLEISPKSVTGEKLATARKYGINRISIGVQSFNKSALELARRNYAPFEEIEAIVKEVNNLGYETLNIDLIGGLPGETPDDFMGSFIKTASLKPTSITTYLFRFENSRYNQDLKHMSGFGWGTDTIETYIKNLHDTAKKYQYTNKNLYPQNLNNVFLRSDYENRMGGYPTKWEPELFNSCFGIGVGSRSSILDIADMYDNGIAGQAAYNIDLSLDVKNLAIENSNYSLLFFNNRNRLVNYFLKQMYLNGKVSISLVEKIYKVDLREYFQNEFEILTRLGKLSVEDETVSFVVKDAIEWGVYSKFFYDEETINKMANIIPWSRYTVA